MPYVETTPARVLRIDDLPAKIAATLRDRGFTAAFRYGLKTAFKPDATVPILWAILTDGSLLLCTTHVRRGIWRAYPFTDINAIQTADDHTALRVISTGIDTPDLLLPLPRGTDRAWVDDFMQTYTHERGMS